MARCCACCSPGGVGSGCREGRTVEGVWEADALPPHPWALCRKPVPTPFDGHATRGAVQLAEPAQQLSPENNVELVGSQEVFGQHADGITSQPHPRYPTLCYREHRQSGYGFDHRVGHVWLVATQHDGGTCVHGFFRSWHDCRKIPTYFAGLSQMARGYIHYSLSW